MGGGGRPGLVGVGNVHGPVAGVLHLKQVDTVRHIVAWLTVSCSAKSSYLTKSYDLLVCPLLDLDDTLVLGCMDMLGPKPQSWA